MSVTISEHFTVLLDQLFHYKTAFHCNDSQGIPTVMGASAIGYVLGKTTYKSTMEDRFLNELPDSNVAKHIRVKRKMEPPR